MMGRRSAGFTLIEMVMVILILGILFSFSIVSISGLAPIYRVRSTSRKIGTKIEELRALAIATGKTLGIRYTLLDDPHYWQMIPPASPDFPDEPVESRELRTKFELPPGVRIRNITFPGGRSIDRGVINVTFSPMGNSGSHVIVLEGRSKTDVPILISMKFNAITGTIDFSDGEGAFETHEG